MTLIALTCQNRREITEHAGQCRNFLIYAVQGQEIAAPRLLELPLGASFHDLPGDQPHALDGVDLLISASMGDGLRRKLAQRGMRTLITSERNPLLAVQRYLQGTLADEGSAAHESLPEGAHVHGDAHGETGHGHAHGHGGCGHCQCHASTAKTPVDA